VNEIDVLCDYLKKELVNVDVAWSNQVVFERNAITIRVSWRLRAMTGVIISFDTHLLEIIPRHNVLTLFSSLMIYGKLISVSVKDYDLFG
jgi:hypothetical protein